MVAAGVLSCPSVLAEDVSLSRSLHVGALFACCEVVRKAYHWSRCMPSAAQVLASHGCRTFNCTVLSGTLPDDRAHVTVKVLQLPDWSPQRKVEAIGALGAQGVGVGVATCAHIHVLQPT